MSFEMLRKKWLRHWHLQEAILYILGE
jgi:hypothetical protein